MSEVDFARQVLALAADHDGLTAEDGLRLRSDLALDENQVSELKNVLSDHFVSAEERERMTGSGLFSRTFANSLAGRDGLEPHRRLVETLLGRAGDDRLEGGARAEALEGLGSLFTRAESSPSRERWLRRAAGGIVTRTVSLAESCRDPIVRRGAMDAMMMMMSSNRYLTRGQTLQALRAYGEALWDPDPALRQIAVGRLHHFFDTRPYDIPENDPGALEAWKGQCRSEIFALLLSTSEDPHASPSVREMARLQLQDLSSRF